MPNDIPPSPSIRLQFRQAARDMCCPSGAYQKLKNMQQTSDTLIVKQSVKKSKSSAQVETFVGQHAVRQISCGLKPEEKRKSRVTTRFSHEERKKLVGRAQKARLTLSEYMRVVTLESPALDPERHKLLLKTNYELTRQGVNLNQIAKRLNAGRGSTACAEGMLAELFDALMEVQKMVHQALSEGRSYK